MNIDSFKEFWALVLEVWNQGFMGVDVGQIVIAVGILLAFLILRRLITWFVVWAVRVWTDRRQVKLDDRIVQALSPPLRFIPIVLGIFFVTQYVSVEEDTEAVLANLNRTLVAFTIFWLLVQLVEPLLFHVGRMRRLFNEAVLGWMAKIVKATLLLVGVAAILELWGIQVGPILAGLGILGVAVAFGAQELFKNLIAGLFIVGERSFQSGDWIKAEGVVEGTVESIGLRTTTVRQFDLAPVYVPNGKLADSGIVNFSQMKFRRINWVIGVQYQTTKEQLRQICEGIENYITENADFVQPPEAPLFVRVEGFNDSSIDLMVYCFTRSTAWGEWLKAKEDLALTVKSVVAEAGAAFALPSRSLYVETVPGGPELFPPQNEAETQESAAAD